MLKKIRQTPAHPRPGFFFTGVVAVLDFRWEDISGIRRFSSGIVRLNDEFPKALPRLVNQVGRRAKTRAVRNLTKQTGLERKVLVKAVKAVDTARPGKLLYSLRTRGGFIRLKYLKPKETRQGVVAKPFGQARLYPGAFMKGGRFPNRKTVAYFGGHVWQRHGPRWQIHQVHSDVRIPDEMVRGDTLASFEREANETLPTRVAALIQKLIG